VRTLRIAAAGAALAALFTLATPAAHAADPGPAGVDAATINSIPADCTLTAPSTYTRSLTCTSRPATQRWRLRVTCLKWVNVEDVYGNIVTGNGTSTATCPTYLDPIAYGFVIVS